MSDGRAQAGAGVAGRGQSEIRVRPDPAKYRRWLITAGPVLAIAAIGLSFRITHDVQKGGSLWLWWSLLGMAVVFIGANLLAFRNDTVFAGEGYVGETSWLDRRKVIRTDDVKSVVRLGINQGRYGSAPKIVVVGHDNRRLMVLDDRMWSDPSLDPVWDRLGHRPEGSFDEVIHSWEFYAKYPKR
jgi:hypothetical protein